MLQVKVRSVSWSLLTLELKRNSAPAEAEVQPFFTYSALAKIVAVSRTGVTAL